LSTGSVSISSPALNEFIPLGVVDESTNSGFITEALEKNKKVEIIKLDSYDPSIFNRGVVAAILIIPSDYDESFNKVLNVQLITDDSNIKEGAVYDAVFTSVSEASSKLTQRRKTTFGVSVEEPVTIETKLLNPVIIEESETRYSSFFLSYLIPLMLFFPIFTVGSIILDSVVGERERKTVESVLVSPINRREVVLSKFLSASLFVFIQLVIWLLIFRMYGIPIQNPIGILFMVLLIDSAIISVALLFTFYSSTVKEANIVLMLLYTFVFISLIVSLSINYFDMVIFKTPFNIISDLVVGEGTSMIYWSIFLITIVGIALSINIKFVERDDIVFGPRPSFYNLFGDLAKWLFDFGWMGYLYLTFVFGIFAIIYATVVEVALGIFVILTFGFTSLLIPLFALIEEAIKPIGLYFLTSKKRLDRNEAILLGVLSGIMFFLIESLFFALATYYLFPDRLLAILRMRISTTLVIHGVSSGIVGYGLIKKNFTFYLLVGTLIHTVFNLVLTGGV
jgi:ABC-2 type transport system permease protein